MSFRSAYDARVVSVRDFDYVLPVHTSYHPLFKAAAKRRITKAFPTYAKAIKQAFANKAATSAWGILIEEDGQPMCVVQNLACAVRNHSYRRVLKINVNEHYPINRITIDTSSPTRNTHWRVAHGPETSRKIVR